MTFTLADGAGRGYFVDHEEMQVRTLPWAQVQVAELAKHQQTATVCSSARTYIGRTHRVWVKTTSLPVV